MEWSATRVFLALVTFVSTSDVAFAGVDEPEDVFASSVFLFFVNFVNCYRPVLARGDDASRLQKYQQQRQLRDQPDRRPGRSIDGQKSSKNFVKSIRSLIKEDNDSGRLKWTTTRCVCRAEARRIAHGDSSAVPKSPPSAANQLHN